MGFFCCIIWLQYKLKRAKSLLVNVKRTYSINLVLRAIFYMFEFCRVKRGGSVGFVLTEQESTENGNKPPRLSRKETGNSSKYSFSTEYTYVICYF